MKLGMELIVGSLQELELDLKLGVGLFEFGQLGRVLSDNIGK